MAIATTILPPADVLLSTRESRVEPIVVTENLWKLYRAGKVEVPALRGVNFKVLPGEFVTVMGPSGCGKSSLIYGLGGLAQASKGHVLVDGIDMRTLWRAIVRVVFWSYERGTWQYDVAVAAIVLFVLFSPRLIHYSDQPP